MGISKKEQIPWTNTARLKLVEAVIKVEKEMMNESNSVGRPSNRHRMAKWKRITELLPPELRGRTWNSDKNKFREFKCSRQFFILLYAYRDQDSGKVASRSGQIVHLTGPVFKILQKREDLLNARCRIRKKSRVLRSGNSNSLGRSEISDHDDEQQLSPNVSSSWKGVQSISSVRKDEKVRPSEHTHELESTDPGHSFDSKVEGRDEWNHVDHDDFTEEDDAYSTLGSRHIHESKHLERKSIPALRYYVQTGTQVRPQTRAQTRAKIRCSGSSTRITPSMAHDIQYNEHLHAIWDGPPRRLDQEFSYPSIPATRTCVRASAQARPQTRARTRTKIRDSDSATKNFPSIAHASYNEHLHATLDVQLRRLEGKFARLSSWVENLSVNEMNLSSAIRSGKRLKLNVATAIEPFEKILDESLSTINDLHVRVLFEKLRIQYAVRGLNSVIQDYL